MDQSSGGAKTGRKAMEEDQASEANRTQDVDSGDAPILTTPTTTTTTTTTTNVSGQQQQHGSADSVARAQSQATAAQLSTAFSSPKQQSVNRKEGASSSATNSPRQFRGRGSSEALNVPPPKPPKTIAHTNSEDGSQRDNVTPIASPSNLSISSKNTVKTGFGQHKNRMELQPPTSFDTSSQQANSYPYSALKSQPRGSASPKLSPMSSSRKAAAPTTASSSTASSQQKEGVGGMFSKLDHPPLPLPRKASKCPLFCAFYAEFDNVVGPKICFQSPLGFMEQDTNVSLRNIHKLLATNFDRILAADEDNRNQKRQKQQQQQQKNKSQEEEQGKEEEEEKAVEVTQLDSSKNEDSPGPASPQSAASSRSPQEIKGSKSGESTNTFAATNISSTTVSNNTKQRGGNLEVSEGTSQPASRSNLKPASTSASNTAVNSANQPSTRDNATASAGGGGGSSTTIFDSTSDFIITGNELTGNIVNLSAFNMHLLTRPTMIHDKRYERNSLLFCVGFVLRRSEDPRPFRPLLSKLALTLKRMEMESHFLSAQNSRQQLQPLLDRVLVSLNCTHWETNLVVNGNILNLKLFHPPKYPASPVPDHAVPILLRREWYLQLYDWDLAINWVVLHIDGVANARQISRKAEVDMEMVRNCLRVLKHHNVISLVDMFFYSNRYESTHRAAALLAGHEPALLQEAADYVMKRPKISTIQTTTPPPYSNLMAPLSPPNASPTATMQENFVKPPVGTAASPGSSPTASSYPPPGLSENVAAARLLGSSFRNAAMGSYQTNDHHLFGSFRREEQRDLKAVLGELYCACNRNLSFGDLWVALASEKARSQSFDRSAADRDKPNKDGAGGQLKEQGNNGGNAPRGSSYTRMDGTEESGSEKSRENMDPACTSPREYYFERLRKKSSCAAVDWRYIFDIFDHRRFVSFGLVNGLLERVHNYPCILEASGGIGRRKGNSCTPSETFSLQRQSSQQEPERLSRNAAAMMDGSHCDDDIVSTFQKPINELVEMVEKYECKKVLPIYSVAMNEVS